MRSIHTYSNNITKHTHYDDISKQLSLIIPENIGMTYQDCLKNIIRICMFCGMCHQNIYIYIYSGGISGTIRIYEFVMSLE